MLCRHMLCIIVTFPFFVFICQRARYVWVKFAFTVECVCWVQLSVLMFAEELRLTFELVWFLLLFECLQKKCDKLKDINEHIHHVVQ